MARIAMMSTPSAMLIPINHVSNTSHLSPAAAPA